MEIRDIRIDGAIASEYSVISAKMNEFITHIISTQPKITPLQTMQAFRVMVLDLDEARDWKTFIVDCMNKGNGFKRGIYETSYGNSCYVSGPKATKAWDLDSAEYIPISEVVKGSFKRNAEPTDTPSAYRSSY